MRFQASRATAKEVIKALENLHQTLGNLTRQGNTLDTKLAEYTFFPLSHIFRDTKTLPARAIELAILCLQLLIVHGWKDTIPPELAKQIVILLAFLGGGSATEAKSKDVNEEQAVAAYSCLTSLFRISDAGGLSVDGAVEAANFPILGHAVSVLLDGIANGPSMKARLGALNALDTLVLKCSDKEMLKNFFPGVVSSLTKLLSGGNRLKSSFKVLQSSLVVLDNIILGVINDDRLPVVNPEGASPLELAVSGYKHQEVKDSWLEATSAQVKLALANILPLRYHEKDEVRRALFHLCVSVLERCRRSLHQSVPMMVETSVVICTQSSVIDTFELQDNLRTVITMNPSLLETLKNSLHDWVVALPRIMQSNDDSPKRRSVDQITIALEILGSQGAISDILNHALSSNLTSSVTAAIQASASKSIQSVEDSQGDMNQLMLPNHLLGADNRFPDIMLTKASQRGTVEGLRSLSKQISS